MHNVIIIGGDHHNTLGMVRSLGSKGISPDVYIVKPNSSSVNISSKFIKELRVFPDDQSVVACLLGEKESYGKEKAVILIGSDHAAACLDENYDCLKDGYILFNAGGHLSKLLNKEVMCQLATKIGLNVPERIVVDTQDLSGFDDLMGGGKLSLYNKGYQQFGWQQNRHNHLPE